jgi:phosphoglycolate phosphatase
MSRPRAILFDWDNTLVDSWGTIHDALNYCFATMGCEPWSLAEVKARTRLSLMEAFPPLFGARWQEARQHYFDRFTAIHLETIKPLAGADAMLVALAAHGIPLGVVSNKTGRHLRREVEHFGWTARFTRIVGAGDAAADKPAAAPVLMALEAAGVAPGRDAWYVGDTAMDMECAAAAGCTGILLHTEAAGEPGLERFPPAFRFADCPALTAHIKAL